MSNLKNLLGTPISDYVATQINKRQADQGSGVVGNRSEEQIQILNSPTSWVKLASGADVATSRLTSEGISETGGIAFARKYMLFGGIFSQQNKGFPSTYQTGDNQFGYVPMPGIESIDVSYLNRGSVKKATVKIKAYNKTQLGIIDLLYLRLGYYVMLEWGNSVFRNNSGGKGNMGSTLIEDKFFDNSFSRKSPLDIASEINVYRKKYSGNYDGLFGRVTNFDWSFNQDGSYDISVTLTSTGDIVESLKLNIQANSNEIKFINEVETALLETPTEKANALESSNDSSPTKDKLSTYLFIQKLLFRQTNKTEPDDITYKIGSSDIKIGTFIEFSQTLTIEASPPSETSEETSEDTTETTPPPSPSPSEPKNFTLPISSTQDKLDVVYLFYSNAEELEPNIPQDLGFYMRFGYLLEYIQKNIIPEIDHGGGSRSPLVNIEYRDVNSAMCYMPGQISLDPRVCIVNSKLKQITAFPQLKVWKDPSTNYAYIMSIYLSFTQIQKSLTDSIDEKGNISLFSFLSSICNELNVALGGVNNLEPIMDEDTNTLKIIDGSYSESSLPPVPYEMLVYGYKGNTNASNFVRNVDIKTQLPPSLQTLVQVSATDEKYTTGVEGTMLNKWNEGIKDSIFPQIKDSNPNVKTEKSGNDDAIQNYVNNFYAKGKLALGYIYNSSGLFAESPELDENAINNNVSIASEFYKYLQFRISQDYPQYSSPIQGLIPINIGLTVDGISGFKIYNSIKIDTSFLPKNYSQGMRFTLKNIKHTVSNQDWETTLETLMMPETYDGATPKVSLSKITGVYNTLTKEADSIELDASIPIFSPPTPPGGFSGGFGGGGAGGGLENSLVNETIAGSNSNLEKQTKLAALEVFKRKGEVSGMCGAWVTYISETLARFIKGEPYKEAFTSGNNAHAPAHREHLMATGLYKPTSLTPVLAGASIDQCRAKAEEITRSGVNFGDVLVYFLNPPGSGYPGAGDYKFHTQLYVGDLFKGTAGGTGWTTSKKNNYGATFVYRQPGPPRTWDMYWFRVKDELKR
jgi:hypothetical protein